MKTHWVTTETACSPGAVSNVHEVRYRLLRERLKQMVGAQWEHDEECGRLALLCLALLERHEVDAKGRCGYCRSYLGWWRRTQKCTVVPLMGYYLAPKGQQGNEANHELR